MFVCVSVRQNISGTKRAIFTKFLCMLPMAVARSCSGMVTIGRIANRREGVTRVHSAGGVIYDCLVINVVFVVLFLFECLMTVIVRSCFVM